MHTYMYLQLSTRGLRGSIPRGNVAAVHTIATRYAAGNSPSATCSEYTLYGTPLVVASLLMLTEATYVKAELFFVDKSNCWRTKVLLFYTWRDHSPSVTS